ncbi:MAG: phenylalanine--tRNA ligase subunit beta [Balneolales bacterium]
MKISYNWLKQYLDFDLTPDETAEKLTLTGLEVEGTEEQGSDLKGVVVGEVLSCMKHPNADRLSVCEVDIQMEKLTIVCGAPNVEAGQKVVVATVGSRLPVKLENGQPLTIRKSKIRGQLSQGMICAEDELGLGKDHSGIMVLDETARPGTPVTEFIPSGRDYIFEIGLTPNRPDASSHIGVARDLAAVLKLPLRNPLNDFRTRESTDLSDILSIEIKNAEKCRRYSAMVVENLTVKESPAWLKNRIQSIGLRSVNNIVDVTNFILHETGQPLHAFDLDLLAGQKIIVRDFDHEIPFTTLDDIERKIPAGSLFICDGEKPIAIAGIMGGQNTEINPATTRVLIESACFEPVSTRKTSKKLNLQSDSSYRFERGVDPDMAGKAAQRCASLMAEVSGGVIVRAMTDLYPDPAQPVELSLRIDRMNKILGSDISTGEAAGILRYLEFGVEEKDGVLYCRVPTFRPDVHGEADLIEEVARIYDYNNIPRPDHLKLRKLRPLPFHERFREKVRHAAKALGLKEIYSNSLLPESVTAFWGEDTIIPTLNPVTRDQAMLRPGLIHGFLNSASYNFKRNAEGLRFFEIGNVFSRSENGTYISGVNEETHLLMGITGNRTGEHWLEKPSAFSLLDLKSLTTGLFVALGLDDQLHYNTDGQNGLLIQVGQRQVGRLSPVDAALLRSAGIGKPAFAVELSLTVLEDMAEKIQVKPFRPIPRFPSFEYDIALVVDTSVAAGELEDQIRHSAGKRLQSVQVFDVFEGGSLEKNQKSIAFRLNFLDESKTLTIRDVDPIIQKVVKKLNRDYSAVLRS